MSRNCDKKKVTKFSSNFLRTNIMEYFLAVYAKKTDPYLIRVCSRQAGKGSRTLDLLITDQLRYHCATPAYYIGYGDFPQPTFVLYYGGFK